jgi:amidohydrolase
MNPLLTALKARAAAIHPDVVALRRDLHAHPELAFEEHRTAGVVQRELAALGIPFQAGVARTGVVGLIEGGQPGPTIALRADMDALPIVEQNAIDYCSTVPGKMHACGHDAHTASLLGTARLLNELRAELPGTVKLIFQPSEEKHPGGASVMVQEGVLENPHVRSIVGQHVAPNIPVGQVGVRSGQYMASSDEILMTIHGKGGHGAHPHTAIDPVTIMAQTIVALQTIVSRNADPRTPSVLTFGDVHATGATNIIPNFVTLMGTFRTFDEAWRFRAHDLIRQLATAVVQGMGGRLEIDIRVGYPVLSNDPAVAESIRQGLCEYMGPENVHDLDLWPASEDFAFYTQRIPGCFYRLGTRNEAQGIVHGLHTPLFNIDESALATSTGLMAWLAFRELQARAQ